MSKPEPGISYNEGKQRLLRMREYHEKGAVKDRGRAQNLAKSYINSVRLREGERGVKELIREVNSR
jgi:hypothetical protein